jgi:thioredoxin reductase
MWRSGIGALAGAQAMSPRAFRGLSLQTTMQTHATSIQVPRPSAAVRHRGDVGCAMAPWRQPVLDAVIVGGGPAGLSAALVLGRARKRVLVLDTGRPANAASSHAIGGLLSQAGVSPAELRRSGRHQLAEFPNVEVRDGEVLDAEALAGGLAISLDGGWSNDVVLLTDGPARLNGEREVLAGAGVRIREEPIRELVGSGGRLERIQFAGGPAEEREALFVRTRREQPNGLADALGLTLSEGGTIETDVDGRTGVPGVYAAGDAATEHSRSVANAVGTGSRVAYALALDQVTAL